MFCTNCGTQITKTGAFCPNCGSKLNNISVSISPIEEKPKKKKVSKIAIILCSVVWFIAIILVVLWFLSKNNNDKGNNDTSNFLTETSQGITEEETVEYIDFYSNIDKWAGKYGPSDLLDFSYYKNGSYCNVSNEHLGVLSAYQYDINNDMNDELITISLLQNDVGHLYISADLFSNVNEIKKINSLKVDNDFEVSELPVLRLGNTDLWTGSYFVVLAFIEDDKLCIMHDVYARAEIGRSETYSNFYIYNISDKGLSLYKHFYCNEEECKDDIRTCKIGETVDGGYTEINIDYKYSVDNATALLEKWDNLKKTEVAKMRKDISYTGLDKYFATNAELERLDWISTTDIFEEDYFGKSSTTCKPLMQLWFANSDNKDDYRSDGITDYTNIKMKIVD